MKTKSKLSRAEIKLKGLQEKSIKKVVIARKKNKNQAPWFYCGFGSPGSGIQS